MTTPELPTTIETADDYVNICENFVLPLFYKQSKKIVEVIEELHKAIDNDDVKQERVDFCINQIKELAAFANTDSAMNPYFQQVADLERKLESQGLLKEES